MRQTRGLATLKNGRNTTNTARTGSMARLMNSKPGRSKARDKADSAAGEHRGLKILRALAMAAISPISSSRCLAEVAAVQAGQEDKLNIVGRILMLNCTSHYVMRAEH